MGDLQAEIIEILGLIANTNNGKLLNFRMTRHQQSLLPYMRMNAWVRKSNFLTAHNDLCDSHVITDRGRELLTTG